MFSGNVFGPLEPVRDVARTARLDSVTNPSPLAPGRGGDRAIIRQGREPGAPGRRGRAGAVLLLATGGLPSAAQKATAGLGPNRAANAPPHRLSPTARALWPAVLRLDREWREHAGRTELQLAAAEAAIAAVPDPVILIDRNRRIVRANLAVSDSNGPGCEPRALGSPLRQP